MALASLGRNVVVGRNIKEIQSNDDKSDREALAEANKRLADARKGILDPLTPWIPGDYLVTYGVLLTAWDSMHGSFLWMIIVAGASAIVYVGLGAAAVPGFTKTDAKDPAVRQPLLFRMILGFLVAIYASVAIPQSGWYDFNFFVDHELSVVVTASALVGAVVLLLKTIAKPATDSPDQG